MDDRGVAVGPVLDEEMSVVQRDLSCVRDASC